MVIRYLSKIWKHLGYIPEGVVNWIALMGWSYDDHTEFFTMQDLIEKFSLEHLNPSPAAINFTKLDYFNGLHIRNLTREDLAHRLAPYIINAGYQLDEDILYQAIPIIRERLVTLDDVIPVAGFFFKDDYLTRSESPGCSRAHSIRISQHCQEGLPDIGIPYRRSAKTWQNLPFEILWPNQVSKRGRFLDY